MDENMSNALMMAAAILIFIMALTITFTLVSQTKETSDYVLYSYDDTKYYDQGYENITYTLADENKINKTVDFQTILPTIYRYIKEHYGVTIMKKDGTVVARFDETTESIVNNWPSWINSSQNRVRCEAHLTYLSKIAKAASLQEEFDNKYRSVDDLTSLWESIYNLGNRTTGNTNIKYGTPWLGDESRIGLRIDADINGSSATFSTGTHNGINLNQYSKNTFKEYFYFVSNDEGATFSGEEGETRDDSVVIRSTTSKLEIIYVIED